MAGDARDVRKAKGRTTTTASVFFVSSFRRAARRDAMRALARKMLAQRVPLTATAVAAAVAATATAAAIVMRLARAASATLLPPFALADRRTRGGDERRLRFRPLSKRARSRARSNDDDDEGDDDHGDCSVGDLS